MQGGVSLYVWLTSSLTGLDTAKQVTLLLMFMVCSNATDSKAVKLVVSLLFSPYEVKVFCLERNSNPQRCDL